MKIEVVVFNSEAQKFKMDIWLVWLIITLKFLWCFELIKRSNIIFKLVKYHCYLEKRQLKEVPSFIIIATM